MPISYEVRLERKQPCTAKKNAAKAWEQLSHSIIALIQTPIATCDNNLAAILSYLAFHTCICQWPEKMQQGMLWLSIQHVAHIFIPI